MKNIKFPKQISKKEVEKFFNKKHLDFIVESRNKSTKSVKQMISKEPYKPQLSDLYRLYKFVILNKRTTILEFGSGWSTLMFSLALKEIKNKFCNNAKKIRRNNLFELFVLENERKYLNITKKRIKKFNKTQNIKNNIQINYNFSEVEMTMYNGNICTQYQKLPLCNLTLFT